MYVICCAFIRAAVRTSNFRAVDEGSVIRDWRIEVTNSRMHDEEIRGRDEMCLT
jgi:hypothetical protein